MHGNLLVCVDNSFESTIAIDLSARLASLSGSGVTGVLRQRRGLKKRHSF